MKTFGIIILTALTGFVLWLIFIAPFTGLHIQTGQGQHTGIITATETNGLFFKTHSAYVKTNAQSSQEDKYCVVGDDVFAKLQALTLTGSPTTIQYIEWLSTGITTCNFERAGVIIDVK